MSDADSLDAARDRLARAQSGLLSALVAGAPDPEGFDSARLDVQRRALTAKRADVVAKVAPELPDILGGEEYRSAFSSYAEGRPMTGGFRQDALDFAAWLLAREAPADRHARRRLHRWHHDRAGARPPAHLRFRNALRKLKSK